jgi:hypothetical protein
MSCGSPTSNSTYAIDPPSPSFADLRWWKIPLAWLAGIALAGEGRCQYNQLFELDDRLLADIGISRTTVEEVRRSPLYLIAWRDSRSLVREAKRLRRRSPKGHQRSLRNVAAELAKLGFINQRGTEFSASSIASMVR